MNQIRFIARKKSLQSISICARGKRHLPSCFSAFQPCNGSFPSHNSITPLTSFTSLTTRRCFSSDIEDPDDEDTELTVHNLHEWFGVEYQNAWQGFMHLEDLMLDKSSRYLIRKLQDLYHGIVQQYDRPTTEQCNKVCEIDDVVVAAVFCHSCS